MIKRLLSTFLAITALSTISFSQTTVTYIIEVDSLVGLELTSGDICTSPWTVEEAKQMQPGNSWGAMWTSTNTGTPTSIEVSLTFSVSETSVMRPTTLNGMSNNSVDPGAAINCEVGTLLTWDIDPAGYVPMGLNTFLVDYTGSTTVHQVDNILMAQPIDPYIIVTVIYGELGGAGIGELINPSVELVKITDLMGRETSFAPNTPLIYVYSDGSVRRIFEFE
ncbi:MAG: hypothetical protein HRT57_16805 [Crocinitomicaceae bacterium]|nr:hypothetical protein [Crocinitomicaceae bacterium]